MSATTHNEKLTFAFPGASVHMCGSEANFYRRHKSLIQPYLEEGSCFADTDFVAALLDSNRLNLCEREDQLFSHAFNCGIAAVYLHHGFKPYCMAGYSMGIYAALSASGTISFGDSLAMVAGAYSLAAAACTGNRYCMAVVIGFGNKEFHELIHRQDYKAIRMVNSNNDSAKILSGDLKTLNAFLAEANDRNAFKAELLDVSLPYHHPDYLSEASLEFERMLRTFTWNKPTCPIVSSIDQNFLTEPKDLLQFTAKNLSTPVSWQDVMATLSVNNVQIVIECGMGISLTQNGRMIPSAPRFVNVQNSQPRLGV
jgi:acyl transferase domain-containing protein